MLYLYISSYQCDLYKVTLYPCTCSQYNVLKSVRVELGLFSLNIHLISIITQLKLTIVATLFSRVVLYCNNCELYYNSYYCRSSPIS